MGLVPDGEFGVAMENESKSNQWENTTWKQCSTAASDTCISAMRGKERAAALREGLTVTVINANDDDVRHSVSWSGSFVNDSDGKEGGCEMSETWCEC